MNSNYDRLLLRYINELTVLMCILGIVAVIVVFLGVDCFKRHKKGDGIACVCVAVIGTAAIIGGSLYLKSYRSDVKNQSYIRYEGVFEVTHGEFTRAGIRPFVQFENEEKSTQYYDLCGKWLANGQHEGYIIYAERSRVIVEWRCYDCEVEEQ